MNPDPSRKKFRMKMRRKKSEKCEVEPGILFPGRIIMLGWEKRSCVIKERELSRDPQGFRITVLRSYKMERTGRTGPSGRSLLQCSPTGVVEPYVGRNHDRMRSANPDDYARARASREMIDANLTYHHVGPYEFTTNRFDSDRTVFRNGL